MGDINGNARRCLYFAQRKKRSVARMYILKSNRIVNCELYVPRRRSEPAKPVLCSSRWKLRLLLAVKLIGDTPPTLWNGYKLYSKVTRSRTKWRISSNIFLRHRVHGSRPALKSFRVRGISNFYQLSGIDFLSRWWYPLVLARLLPTT